MMFDKNRHLYLESLRNGVQNFGRFSCKIEVVYDDPVEHRFQICRWDGINIWDDLDTKVIAHTIQLVKEFLSNRLIIRTYFPSVLLNNSFQNRDQWRCLKYLNFEFYLLQDLIVIMISLIL